ncbi:MAG: hypothetical protein CVU56_07870 [Deltaproteobacteria bacterium HGW-Deltaproteobacteria-14]|jgi:hypothetical protein|nr:MAG: hypothetical protein CVU56_07870 [Deltaproteobacteria bacterium HGW-Deltaproteobacteria-14]
MIRLLAVLTLVTGLTSATGCGASPEPAAPAPWAAAPGATTADLAAQLTSCGERLGRCEKDKTGAGLMTVAYVVLWAILVGFFFSARSRQRRLILEIRELKARLARSLDDRGSS